MTNRQLSRILDVHSHIPIALDGHSVQSQGKSVDDLIALMDRHHIQACVLSVPEAANEMTGAEANEVARKVNELLADYVKQRPDRFAVLATVPAQNMEGTLSEMAYALDVLKLDGVATSTSINDVYLGDPMYTPWFEEMNRRQVTLFCHPVGAMASKSVDLGLHPSGLEFMFDTTRMLANLVFTGTKARSPDIKIISTHGGGTLPYLVTRLQSFAQAFGTGGPNNSNPRLSPAQIKEGFASFYYDLTAATSSAQLHALLQLVPVSHLLLGFDQPYMPELTIPPAQSELLQSPELSDEDLKAIAYQNAEKLFPRLAQYI